MACCIYCIILIITKQSIYINFNKSCIIIQNVLNLVIEVKRSYSCCQ